MAAKKEKPVYSNITERVAMNGRKTWSIRYSDYDGTKRRETFDRFDLAVKRQEQVRTLKQQGKSLQPEAGVTLGDFAVDSWKPYKERKNARTWARDRSIYNNYIKGRKITRKFMDDISTRDVERWLTGLQEEHGGEKLSSIATARIVLSGIFTYANKCVGPAKMLVNPVAGSDPIDLSQTKSKREDAFDVLVCDRVRWCLRNDSSRQNDWQAAQDSLFFSFQLLAGLRPGEVMALTWSDVAGKKINVDSAVSGRTIGRTKTGGKRWVEIVPPLREEINSFRQMVGGLPGDHVIQKLDGNHWATTTFRNYSNRVLKPALARVEGEWPEFRKALVEAGVEAVPPNPEGLSGSRSYETGRHTHAAVLLNSHLSITSMALRLGHSTQVLHGDYSRVLATRTNPRDHAELLTEVRRDVDRVSERFAA